MVSLGFATVKRVISYVIGAQTGTNVAILRMFSTIPLHAACYVLIMLFDVRNIEFNR